MEAGGQHFHGFRHGLDYAFIRVVLANVRMRSVLSAERIGQILVPAQVAPRQVYESLQGRPEVGPLPTPRRCHAIPRRMPSGFTDVSSVLSQLSQAGATLDRTPVRKR